MTAYERLTDALRGTGGRVMDRAGAARAKCPAHESSGLTLSVKATDDGALVHCFAGCDAAGVLAAVGLGLKDLYDGDLPAGYVPRRHVPRNPLGDPDHFSDRILQQERLEADPDWRASRVAELEAAKPHTGDFHGRTS